MSFFRNYFNLGRLNSTIYGALSLNSMACLWLIMFCAAVFKITEDFILCIKIGINYIPDNMVLFLSSIFMIMVIWIIDRLCSRTKEKFGPLNCYKIIGIFSEIHFDKNSKYSSKIHSIIDYLPTIFQEKPNEKFVLFHTFSGVYERFNNTKLFYEKFGEKPFLYKSYTLPWVYIVGLIVFSVKSTRREQDFTPKSKRPVTRFLHAIRRILRESLCYSMPLVRLPPLRIDPR